MTTPRSFAAAFAAFACLLTLGLAPASAQASRSCKNFLAGTAYFAKIRVTNVSCSKAKRLLDRTTLTSNRGGATYWTYGGWRWSITGVNEMENRIRGTRGSARITAHWSQS